MRKRKGRGRVIGAVPAVVLAAISNGWAGISFDAASRITITHDADLSNAGDVPFSTGSIAVPRSSLIYPVNPYQLDNTFTLGASSSDAFGSLGQVTNSTTGSFVLATGTGVSQSDPDEVYTGASSLKFDVNTAWNVTSGGFGPLANGYASLTAGGVVGAGGSAELHINLSFLSGTGAALRTPWIVDQVWGPGAFTQVFTTSRVLGAGSLASGTRFQVVGTIEFRASNAESPTTLTGLRNEFGGAPPTAIFKPDTAGSWFDSGNWEPANPDEPGLLPIANGVGHRALFYGTNGPQFSRVVSIDNMVTLGTLDVDGNTPHVFNATGSGGFNFSTLAGNAVINMRPLAGASAINAPATLNTNLDVITEGQSSLLMSGPIGGGGGITKFGSGVLELGGSNTYSGQTTIGGGTLRLANLAVIGGAVSIGKAGTLTGSGRIDGMVNVAGGGQIAPGDGIGTLNLSGLTLQSDARLIMDVSNGGVDRINVVDSDALQLRGPMRIVLNASGDVPAGEYVLVDYAGTTLKNFGYFSLESPRLGPLAATLRQDTTTQKVLLRLQVGSEWNLDGSGSWNNSRNWTPFYPDSPAGVAIFGQKITAPATVTIQDPFQPVVAAQAVIFENAQSYTLAGTGQLSVGSAIHAGSINVLRGNHFISAIVTFSGSDTIDIAENASLSISGGFFNSSRTLVKEGLGTLTLSAFGQKHDPGSMLEVHRGRLNLIGNSNGSGANLNLMISGNIDEATSIVVLSAPQDLKELTVDSTAPGTQTLDLKSGTTAQQLFVVKVYATDLDATKAALYEAIVNPYTPLAASPQDGIIDSGMHANSRVGIAKINNYVMIRSSRIGDLNLDGFVTIADFIDLASHFGQPANATWQEGDLNYDGSVTIADFIDLASNFNSSYAGEAWPISAADATTLASFAEAHGVPEPGIGIALLALAGLVGRRQRSGRV